MDDENRKNGPGYETRDVNMSVIVIGLVSVGGLCLVTFLSMVVMFRVFLRLPPSTEAKPPTEYGRLIPPEPRLQPEPPTDLKSFRAAEEAFLHTYGWINREAGVVRIPIDEAMELVVQRGLPEWEPVEEMTPPGQSEERVTENSGEQR